jgi:hypothetical protein
VAATRTTTSLPSTASTWMSEAERVRAPTASSRGRCNVLGRMSGRTCTRTSTGPGSRRFATADPSTALFGTRIAARSRTSFV